MLSMIDLPIVRGILDQLGERLFSISSQQLAFQIQDPNILQGLKAFLLMTRNHSSFFAKDKRPAAMQQVIEYVQLTILLD
jgi:hypothetical protein